MWLHWGIRAVLAALSGGLSYGIYVVLLWVVVIAVSFDGWTPMGSSASPDTTTTREMIAVIVVPSGAAAVVGMLAFWLAGFRWWISLIGAFLATFLFPAVGSLFYPDGMYDSWSFLVSGLLLWMVVPAFLTAWRGSETSR